MDRLPLRLAIRNLARVPAAALAAACAPARAEQLLRLEAMIPHRIAGLRTPQGLGHLPALDLLLVADGGDGWQDPQGPAWPGP
jgi:hypothetical protein